MDDFCGSQFWDWNLTWNTETFPDFTPCFERTVLPSIPCIFLWTFSVFDCYSSYRSNSSKLTWSPLTVGKITLTLLLVVLEIGTIVETRIILPSATSDAYWSYPIDFFVPAVRTTTLILSIFLLVYSKRSGVRSSGVQFIFWLLFTLTQAIRFQTVLRQSTDREQHLGENVELISALDPVLFITDMIYFPLVLGQFILHCWADMANPTDFDLASSVKNSNPEGSSSFLSKVLFEWYTPLAWKGFRKPLESSDLWNLSWENSSSCVVPTFDRYWPNNLKVGRDKCSKTSIDNKSKGSATEHTRKRAKIFPTVVKAFGISYLGGFCIRIIADLMMFISPLILNLLIDFVESDEPTWKGIFYAMILFMSAFISTVLDANGMHIFYKIGIRLRTSLISAVYRKSFLLSNSARRERSTGSIVNHMSVDVAYVAEFAIQINKILTTPIIVGLALYFLYNILGVAAFAGVVIMFLLLPLNALLASRVQRLQKEQMAWKDKRTKLMTELLNGIKVLKLYCWEPSFEKQVMKIREEELRVLKQTAYWNALSNFLWTCAPFLVAIGTFGTYVLIDSSNVLDAQTAFVSLSLFNVMGQPLSFLPIFISNYIQAAVGIKRLNEYLNADEIDLEAVSYNPSEPNPVVIENGNFSWDVESGTSDTLQDINLQVKDGELVAIVGPIGFGKSSLLSALLNELVKTKGRVNIRGSVAYVAQQAWIQNNTVRDNILFGRPYDPVLYNRVVDSCALRPDLEMLPAGDKTEIGEKGINLSGGQKQRISLARAVYSNAEIYLLDDPLSAVDAHVGKHIFEKVIGPKGLLRKKTRLLVTHGIVHLPFMDNIVVMANGKISEVGSYQALLENKGTFSEFLKQHSSTESSISTSESPSIGRKRLERSLAVVSDSESEFSSSLVIRRRKSSTGSFADSLEPKNDKLIETEAVEKEGVKASVYLEYFRAAGWGTVSLTLIMNLIFQGFAVGANMWLSQWTVSPVASDNATIDKNRTPDNNFYLAIFAALGFFQAISILLASIYMALGTVKSANVLHLNMLQRILRAPLQFFDVTPIGRIVNRFSRDVDTLDNKLPLFLRYLVNSIFQVLAVLVVISISTPIFTIVIIPVGILYYLIQRFYVATSRQLKRLESISRSPIYSHFGETVSGASTIRAYGQQERFILESERRQDHNMMSLYSSVSANRWIQIRLETVGNSVVFFAALFAVLGRETLNAGMVGLSVSYALQITMALMFLVRSTSDVETNIVAVERMKEYSNCPQEAPWMVKLWRPPPEWPQNGAIVFDQYKSRYRPGLELVLRNVTCSINPGEKVGIVGRTGVGKSSITLGLFRIVEAAGGQILVDGQDISRFGLHDVRKSITIIPQEPVLFSGSLKMNLDPFEKKQDFELWRALELAHLKNFVDGLPDGLNYEITEGGENLSVGQRQLLCLARALLRKTKILILDEATSAVDLDTEELILKTIRSEFKDSTVLTIAHRLNTILDSDRVIVLEKGEIREFDKPDNLLTNQNSIFAVMAKEAGIPLSTPSVTVNSSEPAMESISNANLEDITANKT